jgi:translation initiation factor 1
MGKKSQRVDTGGGSDNFGVSAFGGLSAEGLPEAPSGAAPSEPPKPSRRQRKKESKPPQRVDVRREKSGRGGKTVCTVSGFTGWSSERLDDLCRRIKKQLGTGGTVRGQTIEFQGESIDRLLELLEAENLRPIRAGG